MYNFKIPICDKCNNKIPLVKIISIKENVGKEHALLNVLVECDCGYSWNDSIFTITKDKILKDNFKPKHIHGDDFILVECDFIEVCCSDKKIKCEQCSRNKILTNPNEVYNSDINKTVVIWRNR